MKLLVYGAGVIGSYLAHVLCAAGHDVSILARGQRKEELTKNGLIIRHYIQRKTTCDHPKIVGGLESSEHYDAVFAVMQYQQMQGILGDLARADSPVVVLVGNNLSAAEMEEYIKANTTVPKTVVFGFQGTGGRRENGESVCVRAGAAGLECGLLHSLPDARTKEVLDNIFQNSKYKLLYQPGMQAWYECHLALILPIAYLCYALDCDLTRASRAQLRQTMDAAREGYRLLQGQGVPILPQDEARYFEPGPKRVLMFVLLWVTVKTTLGRLAVSDHCSNAVTEMHTLEDGFQQVRSRTPAFSMPQWDSLRAQMPDWDSVTRKHLGRKSAQQGSKP